MRVGCSRTTGVAFYLPMLVYRHRCRIAVSTEFQWLEATFYTVDPSVVEQDSCSYLLMAYFSSRVAPCTPTHRSVWLWQTVVSASSPHYRLCRCSARNVVRMSVVCWGVSTSPNSGRGGCGIYDFTAHIFLILSLTCTPKSVTGR